MTEREALKLALVALETDWGTAKAITAIKEALAQPQQEPYGYFKAEPFGWTDCAETDVGAIALYTFPPPAAVQHERTWVGLTDEEALECWPGLAMYADCAKFWENIEAKLKEKNDR